MSSRSELEIDIRGQATTANIVSIAWFMLLLLTSFHLNSLFVLSAGSGGWSPDSEDHQPWLQLDLRDRLEVTAVATQGRWGSADWVSSYQLQYSDSGRTWRSYRQDNMPWVRLQPYADSACVVL